MEGAWLVGWVLWLLPCEPVGEKRGRSVVVGGATDNRQLAGTPPLPAHPPTHCSLPGAGADLANLLNEAAILTGRRNLEAISQKEIDDSIDRIVAGGRRGEGWRVGGVGEGCDGEVEGAEAVWARCPAVDGTARACLPAWQQQQQQPTGGPEVTCLAAAG